MINVNLLPPEIKGEIAQSKKNKQMLSALIRLVLIVILYAGIFVGFYLWFKSNLDEKTVQYTKKESDIKKYEMVEEKSNKIAERLSTIEKIEGNTNIWSKAMDEIANIVPGGISLKTLKIDSNSDSRDQITGQALSKTEVAAFRTLLENSKKFQYVDIEKSSTEKDQQSGKEFEEFTISFSLEKGALR